ncbi:MAG: ABC transporter substrate-binding protein [Conexivisphaera sp.]
MRRNAISKTMLWVIIAVVIIVVVVGGVAAYYATRPPPPKPTPTPTPTHAIVGQLTFGLVTSLTGPLGPSSEEELWGAQLAVSQINSQGGIYLANGPNGPGNYTINLVWQDDQSNPAVGPTAIAQIVTAYHPVILILGQASGVTVSEMPLIRQYAVPTIDPSATALSVMYSNYSGFNPADYMVFKVTPPDIYMSKYYAEWLMSIKSQVAPNHPLRIAYIGQDSALGRDYFWGLNNTIYQNGWQNQLQIVYVGYYPAGSTQYQSILAAVAATHPDVIASGGWPNELIAQTQQAAEVPSLKGVIMSTMSIIDDDPSVYQMTGPAGNGMFIETGAPVFSTTSNATFNAILRSFINEYNAMTGHMPGWTSFDGHAAVWVAAYALEEAGTTNSTAVIHALETMPPIPASQLVVAAKTTSTLFDPDHVYHAQFFVEELFWNSTSQSLYAKIVWPSQYATTSPVIIGLP